MGRIEFSEVVYYLCVILKCSETSGYRTESRNRKVGGHKHSRHKVALARDIVPDVNTPRRRKTVVEAARRLGLAAKDETDHVHLQVIKKTTK